jgi:hypothetical protein
MADNTSDIAGNYAGGIRITCILDEGAPTIVDSFDQMGLEAKSYTFARRTILWRSVMIPAARMRSQKAIRLWNVQYTVKRS